METLIVYKYPENLGLVELHVYRKPFTDAYTICCVCVLVLGINILGVVENMSSVSLPMSELKNTHSSIKLVNSRGENMTDSVLFR